MSDLRAAAQQALEALEGELLTMLDKPVDEQYRVRYAYLLRVITALREALAQLVQEPVAWLYPEGLEALQNGKCWTTYPTEHEDCNIPLYTASLQRPWVRLTEQERNDLEDALGLVIGKPLFDAIEAALKERNT